MSTGIGTAIALVAGLTLAAFTYLVAIGIGGAGHGWVTPFFVSFAGLAVFPIGVAAIVMPRRFGPRQCVFYLGLGLVTDILVIVLTLNEGIDYFESALPGGFIWIALWLSWQVPFLLRLIGPFEDVTVQ